MCKAPMVTSDYVDGASGVADDWRRYSALSDSVPGWFPAEDQELFGLLLESQASASLRGDVLEIGVFQGQSAILLGYFLDAGRPLIACDVFDEISVGTANETENVSYKGVRKSDFLSQWDRFHGRASLDLHICLSDALAESVAESSVRFLHVDGSHLYEVVQEDLALAHRLLIADGVIVLDDYRSAHTPGVAAAAWSAVVAGDLFPFLVTPQKMYASFSAGVAERWRHVVSGYVPSGLAGLSETVAGVDFDVLYPGDPMTVPELPRDAAIRAGRDLARALREGAGGLRSRIPR